MRSHHIASRLSGLALASILATGCSGPGQRADTAIGVDTGMGTLVTAEWLSEHLGEPDLVVLDCTVVVEPTEDGGLRTVSGRTGYEEGHIPTAGFADLMTDLADGDNPYEFALPTPERFAAAMGALGVGDDTRVVLYDASNSAWAARVWWMLRWVGFDDAALLDGGLNAWKAGDRPLSTEPSRHPVRTLTPGVRPQMIADRDEVRAGIGDDAVMLIDSLPPGHYRGDWTMYARPGHIRGASNVPISSLVDDTGRYLPTEELEALFEGDRNARAITYCGGGIAASSNAFIMSRLGFTDVAVYISSLQEWTADPANPMETATEFDELDE